MRPFLAGTVLVALTAALSGCISGAFSAAFVPELPSGWARDSSSSGGTAGLPPLITAQYFTNIYQHALPPVGSLYVVSVSDVPLVDEQDLINKQLQPRLQEAGVTLKDKTRGSGSVSGQAVNYLVSDATGTVQGQRVAGLAIDVSYTCSNGEAVRLFGFSMLDVVGATPLINDPRATWEEMAGRADQGQIGGMVTTVKCA